MGEIGEFLEDLTERMVGEWEIFLYLHPNYGYEIDPMLPADATCSCADTCVGAGGDVVGG